MKKSKREHIIDDIHMTPDVTYIHNVDVSHEKSDVNVRLIILFGAGLLVFGIIVQVLMWLMFNYMEKRAANQDATRPRGPMALSEKERLPEGPRLQAAPGFGVSLGEGKDPINLELREPQAEFTEMLKIWEKVLEGKPDPRNGKLSMPIVVAMEKVVRDNQLPVRPPAAGQQQIDLHGVDIPTYQSSGRMTEKKDQ